MNKMPSSPHPDTETPIRNSATFRVLKATRIVLLAGLLLIPAYLNGGPIWFPDSVEYVPAGRWFWDWSLWGKSREYFGQRSILYSAMIWLVHWDWSSWPIVVLHSLLVSLSGWIACRVLVSLRDARLIWLTLATTFLVTGVGIYTSFLMPDVLAGIVALNTLVLLFGRGALGRWEFIYIIATLWFGLVSHASNLPLFGGIAGIYCVATMLSRERRRMKCVVLPCATAVLATFSICLVHLDLYGVFSVQNPLQPPFLLARVLADEPGRTFMKAHSQDYSWRISKYADNLPSNESSILWDSNGIWASRSAEDKAVIKAESGEVIRTIIWSDPIRQLRSCANNIFKLLTNPVDRTILNSPPKMERITRALSEGMRQEYLDSKHPQGGVELVGWRWLHAKVYWLSLAMGLGLLISTRTFRVEIATLLGTVFWNAAMTATLSGPIPRYHERITWVLTLVLIGLLFRSLSKYFVGATGSTQ